MIVADGLELPEGRHVEGDGEQENGHYEKASALRRAALWTRQWSACC